MGERDFGVWIPVVKYEGGKPGKIGWYLPYVFVDNVAAMVTGREVFGFFKQTATLAMPPAPAAPGAFSIDALVIQKFSPESEAQIVRLMTMTSTEGAAAPAGAWTGVQRRGSTRVGRASRTRSSTARATSRLAWDLMKNMLGGPRHRRRADGVPQAVPRRGRSDEGVLPGRDRGARAPAEVVRRLVRAPARHRDHAVRQPPDRRPSAGSPARRSRATLGFWCQMDFVMQPGKVVAER